MERIGIKVDDEDKAMVLLCSLPNSYKGFILHSRDSLTLEDVKNNLLIKSDIDLDSSKAIGHENVGLFIDRGREKERNQNYDRSRSKSKHRNLICNYCKKKGQGTQPCCKEGAKVQRAQTRMP